jgi:hypothetical protein
MMNQIICNIPVFQPTVQILAQGILTKERFLSVAVARIERSEKHDTQIDTMLQHVLRFFDEVFFPDFLNTPSAGLSSVGVRRLVTRELQGAQLRLPVFDQRLQAMRHRSGISPERQELIEGLETLCAVLTIWADTVADLADRGDTGLIGLNNQG